MYIHKKLRRWPAFLGMTQGGADFTKLESFNTNLSGVELSFKFPRSVAGDFSLKAPPEKLDIFTIDWEQCFNRASTEYFDEKKIAGHEWWYYGSFIRTLFEPIGHLQMNWYISRFNKEYKVNIQETESIIEYLKSLIHDIYETGNGHNVKLRERAHSRFAEKDDPASYQDLVDKIIEIHTIKHPDDYQTVIIDNKKWFRFSTYERRRIIFHLLPLTQDYFLLNMGKFYSDFGDERDRWFPEAEKIIETVMNSVTVKFPDNWEY